jgi:protein-L-isoaspartate(D-aspartate) O-methyltransferase
MDLLPEERRALMASLLRTERLSPAVFEAMVRVPREAFIPAHLQALAFEDGPLPIGDGQTISQPAVVGIMTELCRLGPDDRVLEVGTGSGYQTAILAELAAEVFSVEIREHLSQNARAVLDALGYANIQTRVGDGHAGWPEQGPFDAIMVTAAPAALPPALPGQLKEGGRLVLPVGVGVQELMVGIKKDGAMVWREILPVRFVPLVQDPAQH